ncbi:MAG: YicC/YloC family endoribonuclease [Alphaproteobacteria bacterium]
MLQSMTGFGTLSGQADGISWVWEARSVNGRGLDIRLRLPEGAEALEPVVRAAIPKHLTRGNVSVNLKLVRAVEEFTPKLNSENLEAVVIAAQQARLIAEAQGLELAPVSVGELLSQKGIWDAVKTIDTTWSEVVKVQIPALLGQLKDAREAEGKAIVTILSGQNDAAAILSKAARTTAQERGERMGSMLREKVLALLEITELADENRLAQELALLAVKADVAEELDRLDAHIAAARNLLKSDGPIGRKFDFLMQEFNREANTLCSKSGSTDLTAIGLELKVVIDQMREQVQNLE